MSLFAQKLPISNIRKKKSNESLSRLSPKKDIRIDSSQSMPFIQTKLICPCDGGCPRCTPVIQPKLKIGQPNDKYEQEADRVAEQVMRMPEPQCTECGEEEEKIQTKPLADQITPLVQRQVEPEEEEEEEREPIQAKLADGDLVQRQEEEPEEEEEEEPEEFGNLQTKRNISGAPRITPVIKSYIKSLKGSGKPLPESTRAFFEPRFGYDFNRVRVHTDQGAACTAHEIAAQAYTVGYNIVFGHGRYSPWASSGQRLLSHELAHVTQQNQNRSPHFGIVMRRWDKAPEDKCRDAKGKWIKKVVVEQEVPQSVTIHWSDGSTESDECSTGKGLCCIDSKSPEGVACTVKGSKVSGTNCTPITERQGYPVKHRDLNHKGIEYWTEFEPDRHIALHDYDPLVNGRPRSHGCVRLHKETSRKIFCGARKNKTWVQVRGFSRPKCDDTILQEEWRRDFEKGGRDLSAYDGDERASIRMTQRALNKAFGHKLTVNEIRALTISDVPRCGTTAKLPTAEQARLIAPIKSRGTIPTRIIAASGLDKFLVPFTTALSRAHSLSRTRRVVSGYGKRLYRAAVKRAQATSPSTDDRVLYWARLQMTRALRQWQPRFSLTPRDREDLMTLFEHASRGMKTVTFTGQRSVKKILISGFDPFKLGRDIRYGNPSGAAVLALDGREISNGGIKAEIQGVIFPVNPGDFDTGMVENFFRPYMKGKQKVDMVMAIGMGGSKVFEVEEYAAPPRSSAKMLSKSGQPRSEGSQIKPEFYKTTLPTQSIRSALNRTLPLKVETEVIEIPAGKTSPVRRPKGPTPGSTPVKGPAGTYLCNEIFYRISLLRKTAGSNVPAGFLHTPLLPLPKGTNITDMQFEKQRNIIINTIKKILESVLPKL